MIKMEKITQEEILKELSNFSGTQHYYKGSYLYNLNLTDGMQYFREKLDCYWLIDIVGSVQHLKQIKENSFILWRIKVNKDKSFIVQAFSDYDDSLTEEQNKKYLLYEQEGKYTDFILSEYEFYQEGEVLLLKNEH
jgi:hypothetical protein